MTITLSNIGPITKLDIPLPDKGGIVVLRGGQGEGKSTALRAVSRVLGGKPDGLSARDGEKKGVVEFGSAKLSVTRARTQLRGSLEVESIEGQLDISTLVDPGIKDPEAADLKRIKSLILLTGVQATVEPFRHLIGERAFSALGIDTDTDDPVELCGRVKRAVEKAGRAKSIEAKATIETCKSLIDSLVEFGECEVYNEDTLSSSHADAVKDLIKLESRAEHAIEQQAKIDDARQRLAEANESYTGVADALQTQELAKNVVNQTSHQIAQLEQQLDDAKAELASRLSSLELADAQLKMSQDREAMIARYTETIRQNTIESPTDEEISTAKQRLEQCTVAINRGMQIRDSIAKQTKIDELRALHKQQVKAASRLRDAAKSCEGILSDQLPAGHLRVEGGRLVTETDRSKSELYSELSDGERWTIAIDIVSGQLGEHGLIVIPQIAWEGLTDSTRTNVDRELKSRGIVALTAEAVDGAIHAEIH